MAVIKAVNSKASIGKAINYVTKKEKTEEKLISGKDCNPKTAIDEMKATKELWQKTEGRQYTHLVQSFDPKDDITPELAHNIGKKFIEESEKFKGHEVLISTHVDRGHIHNHFIVNSVNFEDGKKIHVNKKELAKWKEQSNQLSRENGLTVPVMGDKITSFNQKKYKAIEKGFKGEQKSYLLETAKEVSSTLKIATTRQEFIQDMEKKGYQVHWSDTRKNITYTTPEGKKVRNSNLEKTFKQEKFSKEGMENELHRNRETGRTESREITNEKRPSGDAKDILLNGKSHEINGSRTSDINKSNDQDHGRKSDRPRELSQKTGREREGESRVDNKTERGIQRHETRNVRPESNEPSRNREEFQRDIRGQSEERANSHGNDKADKGHGVHSKTDTESKLEGKSKTVHTTTPSNDRSDSGIGGSISTGEPFSEILKSLGKSIKKTEGIEEIQAEQQQKAIEKQKQIEKAMERTSKTMDYDLEL